MIRPDQYARLIEVMMGLAEQAEHATPKDAVRYAKAVAVIATAIDVAGSQAAAILHAYSEFDEDQLATIMSGPKVN